MGILNDFFRFDFKRKNKLNAIHMIIAMAPAGILGISLSGFIKDYLFGASTVLIGLVIGGVLMIVAEKANRKITSEHSDDITYKQAFGIGRAFRGRDRRWPAACCSVRAGKRRRISRL